LAYKLTLTSLIYLLCVNGIAERGWSSMFSRFQQISLIKSNYGRWASAENSRRRSRSPTRGRSRSRSGSRNIEASALAARFSRQQQPLITPPFYRIFWFLHNVSLVATPISFLMFGTFLYEGLSTCE